MKKNSKEDTPKSKQLRHADMSAKIKKGDAEVKNDIIALLKNKSFRVGSQEKNLAIQLAEENKMTDAVPYLYNLLKEITVSGVGEKVKDPSNALINIGQTGKHELVTCIENDDPASIPYQTIAAILFHWFDENKSELKKFLTEQEKKASKTDKTKFAALINIVDHWK